MAHEHKAKVTGSKRRYLKNKIIDFTEPLSKLNWHVFVDLIFKKTPKIILTTKHAVRVPFEDCQQTNKDKNVDRVFKLGRWDVRRTLPHEAGIVGSVLTVKACATQTRKWSQIFSQTSSH